MWVTLGDAARGDRVATPPVTMVVTVLHPHEVSRFKKLTVVAIDLRQTALHYVPGTADLADAGGRDELAGVVPGRVAAADLGELLVVHNGGFKPRHGRWGLRVASQTVVPPRVEGCTVAIFADGRVAIRSWPALVAEDSAIVSFRQTPPCLVEEGQRHPALEAHNERPWGGRDPKDKTRRRSALGIDAGGDTLFYGMGEELEPSELARGMSLAGATHAAQLDINWSWTRFLLIGQRAPDAPLEVTGTLIPQMVHERLGYVEKAVDRDFFYLTRRRK